VKLELCYRLMSTFENINCHPAAYESGSKGVAIPQFDTTLSAPLAPGELVMDVPSTGHKMLNMLPKQILPAGIDLEVVKQIEAEIFKYISAHTDWGCRGLYREQVLAVAIKDDWYECLVVDELPRQYARRAQVTVYRNPETGWSCEQVGIFELCLYGGESTPPVKRFPPIGGPGVVNYTFYDADLLAPEVLATFTRCPAEKRVAAPGTATPAPNPHYHTVMRMCEYIITRFYRPVDVHVYHHSGGGGGGSSSSSSSGSKPSSSSSSSSSKPTNSSSSSSKPAAPAAPSRIEITLENNTNKEFIYYHNGGKNYIAKSNSKTFNCSVGEEFCRYNNGKGAVLIKVTADMHRRRLKCSSY